MKSLVRGQKESSEMRHKILKKFEILTDEKSSLTEKSKDLKKVYELASHGNLEMGGRYSKQRE